MKNQETKVVNIRLPLELQEQIKSKMPYNNLTQSIIFILTEYINR